MTANNLGLSYIERDAPERAAGHYERARTLFHEVGDEHGEHTARANLAWIHFAQSDYQRFLDDMRSIYDFYVGAGSPRNAAITLRGIGLAEAALGRTDEAIADLRTALEMLLRLDDLRMDTAMTFNALGELYQRAGDARQATDAFSRAATTAQRSGSTYEQARAHNGLGEIAAANGDRTEARQQWESALAGYLALRAPHADRVREKLENLDGGIRSG
jgi:tetratricopeptide (TPR) repeat protein